MSVITLYVCTTCRAAEETGEGLRAGALLATALQQGNSDPAITVAPVECLSVCKRPVTVAFAAPGKWTYVYGDFKPEAAQEILDAARLYRDASEGLIPWRARPESLKRGVIARLPPFSPPSEVAS